MDTISLGQLAFEAWKEAEGGYHKYGAYDIPEWNNVSDDFRASWEAVANAVKHAVLVAHDEDYIPF